jgi:large subunit ribosomal protein L13
LTRAANLFKKHRFIKTGAAEVKKYTISAKDTDIKEKWVIIDANGAVLGRLASNVASRLRGKNNPMFTPHADTGESVIVINAEKITLTGNKLGQKRYYRHSGYTGGLKEISAKKLLETKPQDIIRFAVKGMLPKNKLGTKLFKKLKVYAGEKHPHEAQKPEAIKP